MQIAYHKLSAQSADTFCNCDFHGIRESQIPPDSKKYGNSLDSPMLFFDVCSYIFTYICELMVRGYIIDVYTYVVGISDRKKKVFGK